MIAKLFALNSSYSFGAAVAKVLGITLSKHEEISFDDGEVACRPLESVRNQAVYVIQSLYADNEQSIHDKLCRLLFFVGTLKDAAASHVTAIVPYLCYARKDQKSEPRGSVTTRYLAALFESVGIDRVVTIDIHDIPAFQNAFRCPTENLEAKNLFITYLMPLVKDDEVIIMSPDIGGVKRAELFQKSLSKALHKEVPLAFMEKYRKMGVVTGDTVVGNVKGKTVLIVDDMISTGSTIARSVAACKKSGSKEVIAVVTHGIFCGSAASMLGDEHLKQIVVTDTINPFRLVNTNLEKKTIQLSVAPLFAEAIKRIQQGGSITNLLQDGVPIQQSMIGQ